jgi:hypothetical protein
VIPGADFKDVRTTISRDLGTTRNFLVGSRALRPESEILDTLDLCFLAGRPNPIAPDRCGDGRSAECLSPKITRQLNVRVITLADVDRHHSLAG